MILSDEVVIEALLKDAKRFKSKRELRTNEPTRLKPNTTFLQRTISNVVKSNQDLIRKTTLAEDFDKNIEVSSSKRDTNEKIPKCNLGKSSKHISTQSTSQRQRQRQKDSDKTSKKKKVKRSSEYRKKTKKRKRRSSSSNT